MYSRRVRALLSMMCCRTALSLHQRLAGGLRDVRGDPRRDKILGIIDVESSSRNAFTHNDFMALESLAGILASVITSADQYQRLQVMITQLRSTQVELRSRMEAQRSAENRLIRLRNWRPWVKWRRASLMN
jgi:hypothetical protein